jgi:hypothetical protein
MIGPTDIIHPSPTPHFKTFQVLHGMTTPFIPEAPFPLFSKDVVTFSYS